MLLTPVSLIFMLHFICMWAGTDNLLLESCFRVVNLHVIFVDAFPDN